MVRVRVIVGVEGRGTAAEVVEGVPFYFGKKILSGLVFQD